MVFDLAQTMVSKPMGIALETRAGHTISNAILAPLSAADQRGLDKLARLRGANWESRKPHTLGYNCAGHAWASRRTCILDESAVQLIIADDGYRELHGVEGVKQGDLVLYWNETTGGMRSWLHPGVVSELRVGVLTINDLPCVKAAGRIPWVLSKFSPYHGEWLHRYDDAPYKWDGVIIQFLTDRP